MHFFLIEYYRNHQGGLKTMRGNTTRYYEVRVTGQRGKMRGFALCGTYKEAMDELEKG